MAETVTCITNHTGHIINLSPLPGLSTFPEGLKLVPGLNRVPNKYMEAWQNRKVAVHDSDGKPVTLPREVEEDVKVRDEKGKESVQKLTRIVHDPVYRFPGKEELAKLTGKIVRIVTSQGKHMGPQLTVHSDGEIDPRRPDGPPPPVDLPTNEVHAIKLVEVTNDPEALKLWLFDPRDSVKQAVQRQLNGGGKV